VQLSAATLMATVQQIDPVYVDLTQSSVEGLQLRRDIASGQLKLNGPDQAKVTLFLEDGTQYPLPGSLQFTDITVDQGTGSVTVRAIFPNPRFVLLPGMFVRARIEEGVKENAFLVPQVGVAHDPSGNATALVVGPDNKVAIRPVQLKGTSGTQWIVESGLNDGDRVVIAGVQKVQPGTLVQAVESQATTAAATPSDQTTTKATSAMPSASSTTSATTPATPSAAVKTATAAGQAAQPPPGTPASQAK